MQDSNTNNMIESFILAWYTQTIANKATKPSFLTYFDQLITVVTTKLNKKIIIQENLEISI